MTGALFWISRTASALASQASTSSRSSLVVSTILERKQTQVALEGSNVLKGAILDSLPAHIAVVDRDGVIIAVNEVDAFRRGERRRRRDGRPRRQLYREYCRAGARQGAPAAAEAAELLERACHGRSTGVEIEYRCDAPQKERWFVMTVEPLRRPEGGAVVRTRTSPRARAGNRAPRERERFRRLADALPMAIWMSDESGGCTYTSTRLARADRRPLEEENGDGWLEGVHPADRKDCLDAYLAGVPVPHAVHD